MIVRTGRGNLGFLLAVAVFAGLALLLAVACGGGKKNSEPTAIPRATVSPMPALTPTPLLDLKTLDLSAVPEVKALAQQLSGEVAPDEVIYADLTGDGRDDAVIPISSGGTQGDLGFIVLGYQNGSLKVLLSETPQSAVVVKVLGNQLVESLPVYATSDLPGFPSQIKDTYYRWDGSRLIVDHEETVANPNLPRE